MSRDERSGFSRETKICFRCDTQVTLLGTTHVTDFGTTALTAVLQVSVGTPDAKSTCGVGIIIVLFITDFSGVLCGKISISVPFVRRLRSTAVLQTPDRQRELH